MLAVAPPVFQLYIEAPEAVNVAVEPAQTVALLTAIVKLATTVTVDVPAPLQPVLVPVIVYTVVLAGLAVTVEPDVELNPVPGLQLYVVAPVAVRIVGEPEQIVEEFTLTVGVGLTVNVDVFTLLQEPEVPVTE
jgi:hypothetical protein